MPVLALAVPVAANSVVANALSGSVYEYLPFPCYVEIGHTTTATGLLSSVSSGPDILQEEGPVGVGSASVFPKYPDEFYLTDFAAPGDRLVVKLRNTTGGALTAMVQVRIKPI